MSENTNNTANSQGIGFLGALTLLFIGLKLADKIDWPWVWVLAPFWGPIALLTALFVGALVVGLFIGLVKKTRRKK